MSKITELWEMLNDEEEYKLNEDERKIIILLKDNNNIVKRYSKKYLYYVFNGNEEYYNLFRTIQKRYKMKINNKINYERIKKKKCK